MFDRARYACGTKVSDEFSGFHGVNGIESIYISFFIFVVLLSQRIHTSRDTRFDIETKQRIDILDTTIIKLVKPNSSQSNHSDKANKPITRATRADCATTSATALERHNAYICI